MRIKPMEVPVYVLNGHSSRTTRIKHMLSTLGMTYYLVNDQVDEELREAGLAAFRWNRINLATQKLLHKIREDQNIPCIILEDDATLIRPLPDQFDIPEETDLIYLGGSNYDQKLLPSLQRFNHHRDVRDYNETFFRIYNMLGAHAILIPHRQGLELYAQIVSESLGKNQFHDITLVEHSHKRIFLAPRQGHFFAQRKWFIFFTQFALDRKSIKYSVSARIHDLWLRFGKTLYCCLREAKKLLRNIIDSNTNR